jgi:hypothetical protein
MVQARGLVKISLNNDSNPITAALGGFIDALSDNIPYAYDFINWLEGNTNNEATSAGETATQQVFEEFKDLITGDNTYLFFAQDVNVIVHGTNTETFGSAAGGQTGVMTNSTPYREITFKTTIGPRDVDVMMGTWSDVAIGLSEGMGFAGLIGSTLLDAATILTNSEKVVWYLNKRENFLMDIVSKQTTDPNSGGVILSSTLFPVLNITTNTQSSNPAISNSQILSAANNYTNSVSTSGSNGANVRAFCTDISMSTPSGQEETVFDLRFVEMTALVPPTNATTTLNSDEPGTMSLPDGG